MDDDSIQYALADKHTTSHRHAEADLDYAADEYSLEKINQRDFLPDRLISISPFHPSNF
jgi:hypothetical protein